jgi:hypothetical protein
VDRAAGETLFPYTVKGREGHLSLSEAETRALRAAEANIKKKLVFRSFRWHKEITINPYAKRKYKL